MLISNTYYRYLRLGMILRPIRGHFKNEDEEQKYGYAYHFDNIQYVLNDFGTYEESNDSTELDAGVKNLDAILNSSRHDTIKAIMKFIRKHAELKDLWVQVGTADQLQVLFGDKNGVIAQLVMDFSSREMFDEYRKKMEQTLRQAGVSDEEMPEIEDLEEFILVPADNSFEVVFNQMNIPGVIVEYLDDDDIDEDEE